MGNVKQTAALSGEISDLRLAIDRAIFADLARGADLDDALAVLCQAVEGQVPGLFCSILIVSQDGTHLCHGAAPSLPPDYVSAVNGAEIGPNAGSCGTAVYRAEPVIVSNIATDPLWADYRQLALRYGLQACWSTPIKASDGTVSGTFAVYYREPRVPTERERQLVNWATPLAAIAVERKQSSDTLREQREELRTILDAAPAIILYRDKDHHILRANQGAADFFAMRPCDLEGRFGYELYPQEAVSQHQDDLQVIHTGKPHRGILEPFPSPSGEVHWFLTDKFPYRDRDGQIIGVIVFSRDVTEQQRAKEALQEAEAVNRVTRERLELALESSGHFLWDYDLPTDMIYMGEGWQKVLGGPPEETRAVLQELCKIAHPADREKMRRACIETMKGHVASYREEHRVRNYKGEWVWLESRGKVVEREPDGRAKRMVGTSVNITERKRAQEHLHKNEHKLRMVQKMEAVGVLAGGIAHDFNNLLMIIHGQLEMLDAALGPLNPQSERIQHAQKAADRAAALIKQLLAFSRKQVMLPRVINLNSVIGEISKLIPPLIGETIELSVVLGEHLDPVKADPGHIEQIIFNLVINARDAMPHGGKLVLQTANVYLDEAYVRNHVPLTVGRYVMLAVGDTGTGMDAETQARIFEPFFTTKEKGKGTGLGLATVYGMVKQSSGFIWVESAPDAGATFKIYFPLAGEPAEEFQTASPVRHEHLTGTETILLVEDDREVRELTGDFLRHSGYKVLTAQNSADAVAIVREYTKPIHLLLTDVVMPGLNGIELAREIVALRPAIKVMCMSSYSEYTVLHPEEIKPAALLLAKPFTQEAIARAVRQVLSES